MGHALLVWTVTTVVACKYGGHADDIRVLLRRTLLAPPLWVLFIALGLNLGGAPIPRDLLHTVLLVGQVLMLLVPLAMRARGEDIARIATLEMGKSIHETRIELGASAEIFDWYAEEGRRAYGRVLPQRLPGQRMITSPSKAN